MIGKPTGLYRHRDTIATGTCLGEGSQPVKNCKEREILVNLPASTTSSAASAPTDIPAQRRVRRSAERGLGRWRKTRGHLGHPVRNVWLDLIPGKEQIPPR